MRGFSFQVQAAFGREGEGVDPISREVDLGQHMGQQIGRRGAADVHGWTNDQIFRWFSHGLGGPIEAINAA
jgi:hypothetical protein